eukprot:6195777-Pleurochrysis_carterae.AAC.4
MTSESSATTLSSSPSPPPWLPPPPPPLTVARAPSCALIMADEAALNQACTRAKAAAKANPQDAEAQAAYKQAKAAFSAFQAEKRKHTHAVSPGEQQERVVRRKTSASKSEGSEESAQAGKAGKTWTCPICQVTITAEDSRARSLHQRGKPHLKKLKQQAEAVAKAAGEAKSAAPDAAAAKKSAARRQPVPETSKKGTAD